MRDRKALDALSVAFGFQLLRVLRGDDLFRKSLRAANIQAHMMIFLFAEHGDLCFTLTEHGKRRRLDTPDIQRAVIQH